MKVQFLLKLYIFDSDVEVLAQVLPNVKKHVMIPGFGMTLWQNAIDADKVLYNPLIEMMNKDFT